MEGAFKFCLGPLEIQMLGTPDPQQKMSTQCMKWPVAHSPNSTWVWLELVGNCCERLKIIMECTNIQFCERLGHGWQFHPLSTESPGGILPVVPEICWITTSVKAHITWLENTVGKYGQWHNMWQKFYCIQNGIYLQWCHDLNFQKIFHSLPSWCGWELGSFSKVVISHLQPCGQVL